MALNRASDVPAADWLSQAHMKNYRNSACGAVFLNGGNPSKAL